jgi:hypothetical protein
MADTPLPEGAAADKSLSPEALRALEEAAARRRQAGLAAAGASEAAPEAAVGETGGPAGLEPTRYGDWERKGIVSDF